MKFKLLGLFILLLFLFTSTVSYAAQVLFTPRATATETYTDNVDLEEDDEDEEFITNVSVGGTLSILGKTSGMNLSFDPGYVWYADESGDNTWRLPATLNIYSDFSRRTRLTIFDRLLRTEDPGEDEDVVNEEDGEVLAPGDSTVRRERNWYITNYATARIDHQFGSDDSVYGQFLYSLRREEESGPDSNENDRYAPSAGINYWFGPKWGTTLDVTYTRAIFDEDTDYHDILSIFQLNRRFSRHFLLFGRYGYAYRDNDDDDEDDYMAHAPSVGFNYELAPDARISLGLGYYYQDIDGGDNEQAPFVNADIYKLWNYQRWNASLQGLSGLDRNDFGSERLGFEWSSSVSGNARYSFTRNFYGTLAGRYRYGYFINENRKDHRIRVGAGLGWQPTTWMDLNLEYNHNKLNSNETDDYDENRVWLRLTLSPSQPWRF
jgi:opacity protein-like surface antigen